VPGVGHITASLGIASFPQHASSRDTLVVAADRALYAAKHAGRNCVCVPPDDSSEMHEAGEMPEAHADEPPAPAEVFSRESAEASDSSVFIS